MSGTLQIVLLVVSLLTVLFLMKKIRKSQFLIEDSIFWILFSVLILLLAIFPKISNFFANLIGFEAPSNFIFVVFIFLLLIKIFKMNLQITKLQTKFDNLVSKYAIDNHNREKNETEDV